jgi:hypothetical protein
MIADDGGGYGAPPASTVGQGQRGTKRQRQPHPQSSPSRFRTGGACSKSGGWGLLKEWRQELVAAKV